MAQYNLGELYEAGIGVPEDKAKAYALYNLAAGNNYFDSIKRLEKLKRRMTLEQIDAGQKLSRELFGKIKKPQE